MAGKDFGGQIRLRLSNGTSLSLRGTMTLKTTGRVVEAIRNQDGSIDRVSTLAPYGWEITCKDDGQDFEALLKADRFDATFIEDDNGKSHYYTRAFFVGDTSINRMNGEVSGLGGAAETYKSKG
ncbi:hypothetical protein HPDFL43_05835 [Hoeflea phototrophica DFL-43]|jgi:hypothetical protein|uniref:Phage tail tube protein n=1 Tax=Hoeflea phototrophica (strain DSM 17068 / NCIMB 14078 / DFL-43) TaxID=411684 RepID=A9D4S5_HOEPD|nr:phage tail tube protein [Hoeflea phototrophica]EDQ33950.1 hypothetical protein HPDFL43_05835 [Hoeflea phototrophica DFL-43]